MPADEDRLVEEAERGECGQNGVVKKADWVRERRAFNGSVTTKSTHTHTET